LKLLIDTCTFLWFLGDSPELALFARQLISSADNQAFLSTASVWEMAIKISIGKLELAQPLRTFVSEQLELNHIELLPIQIEHLELVSQLPLHHKDPFDRLLAAQSIIESMPIISNDTRLDFYGVHRLWTES
jgi:PIN domain nuclease of toxin-antitoxin system